MTVGFEKALPRDIRERVLQLSQSDNLDYMDELIDVIETGLRVREAGMAPMRRARHATEVPEAQEGSAPEFIQFLFSMPHAGQDSDYDADGMQPKPGR
jgi:cell division inhibitor SulA